MTYPLRFQPIFRRYLWGGRRLQTVLGKPLGEGDDFAESWEVVDHGSDQSVVLAGPLAGKTLQELGREYPEVLYGGGERYAAFPLLFKFLDAHRALSVQVHPNDIQAARRQPPDLGQPPELGKTEAWLILHADPGSVVYGGLRRGVDRAEMVREVRRGTTELCLHRIEPRVGDCIFVPAGVVHALGAGLVVAEIQQSSDTTFRLFDWNRIGQDGRPRELHVEDAFGVIDFDAGPLAPQQPRPTSRADVERLVACDKFIWDRWRFRGSNEIGGDDRWHLVAVVEGSAVVAGDPVGEPLRRGQTMLLPAACGGVSIMSEGDCVLLDAYLPA